MCVPISLICLAFSLTSSNAPAGDACSRQSFDLRVVVIFRDRYATDKFKNDPRRGGALDDMLQMLVRRYGVYNFANE